MDYKYKNNNLFKFATKELSQDALLCWLINWINFKEENEELYNKAKKLLNYILEGAKCEINIDEYKISIFQQRYNIDILLLLEKNDKKYAIIIEDKKFTTENNNQIKKYREKVKDKCKLQNDEIITVYYKPYEELFDIVSDVKLDREYMLREIFNDNIQNPIYLDYKEYLEKIQKVYEDMENIKLSEWKDNKEIFYMVAKEYNEQVKTQDDRMKIKQVFGSTFIDWHEKTNIPKDYKSFLEKIYLSININYDRYELRIRGCIKNGKYNADIRIKIENELERLCNIYGFKTETFSHKEAKNNIELITINLNESDTYKELMKKIEKIERLLDKFIRD